MAVYLIGTSFYAVLSALFGEGLSAGPDLSQRACRQELAQLTRDLYESAGQSVQHGLGTQSFAWTHAWDKRHAELTGRCGPLSAQHADLKALRMDLGALLRQHQRHSAGPRRSLEQMLEAINPSS